jgi:hypothetical protein
MGSPGSEQLTDADLARQAAHASGDVAEPGGALARGALAWIRELAGERLALIWLIPLAVAAVYLVVFAVQLPQNITAVSWDSDYASAFVIAETLVHTGTGGHTVIASSGQWVPLWFGLLTASLPLHRELWGVAPTLLFVATALMVASSVSQLAGRRAGVLAALISLIASPLALAFLMAPMAHNTVYPCTALLGAYLLWLARAEHRRALTALAVPPLLGVVIGACLASDLLLAATAVIPLTFTALLAAVQRDRRSRLVSLSALATAVVALPVAELTGSIMHSLGFVTIAAPVKVVPLSQLAMQASSLLTGLKALFNGYLGAGRPGTLHASLGIASDIAMGAALVALLAVGALATARLVRSGVRRHTPRTPAQLARSVHVVFWAASAVTACGAFLIAGETGGGTNAHESYYATVIFSVAAVVPLLLASGAPARWLIAAGTSVLFAASLAGLTSNYVTTAAWIASAKSHVMQIAAANHVTAGYGGYDEASSLTWNTAGRVTVRPLMECPNPQGADICPFYIMRVPSWYVPQNRRTFLLIDREEAWVSTLPGGLGKPLASYSFGAMRMYIYPYDIATRLGPDPD